MRLPKLLCRALMAGGGAAQAIKQRGEESVRLTVHKALEGYRVATGDYQIENCFQFLIAQEKRLK
jgi:hypothetical protein